MRIPFLTALDLSAADNESNDARFICLPPPEPALPVAELPDDVTVYQCGESTFCDSYHSVAENGVLPSRPITTLPSEFFCTALPFSSNVKIVLASNSESRIPSL